MAVVGGTFGFFVAGLGGPGWRQVKEAVPVNALGIAAEQVNGAREAKRLHLFGAEGGARHLGDPDGQAGDLARLGDLARPLGELPVVPIQREAVHADRVNEVHDAMCGHEAKEVRIAGGDATENDGKRRIRGANRDGCLL